MAASATAREFAQKMYIAYFGRPAAPTGLEYYAQLIDEGKTAALMDDFWNSAESQAHFGALTVEGKVNAIFQQLFGRDAAPSGLTYWTTQISKGAVSLPQAALTILNGASADDLAAFNAKLDAANAFTDALDQTTEILAYQLHTDAGRDYLDGVHDDSTSSAAISGVDALLGQMMAGGVAQTNYTLTVGQDIVTGTSGADHFAANVVQNDMGSQVNTLGSGDVIDGGKGVDTLDAKVTSGVYAGGNGALPGSMPIQPEIHNVENINLQAVIASIMPQGSALPGNTGSYLNNDVVFLNGKDITDLSSISSVHSDASLVVQNLTTEHSDGTVGRLSDVHVGMKYSGNPDHMWSESNLEVYFDQDYLVPEATSTRPAVEMRLMNEDSYDVTRGAKPLDGVYVAKMAFVLDGKSYDLAPYLNADAPNGQLVVNTYAELLTAVQAAIVKLQAANPTDAALQTLTASLGSSFQSDISPITGEWRTGTSIQLSVDGLTNGVQNTLTTSANDLTLNRADNATVENNNRYERAENNPPVEGQKLAINVDLEKAGLDGDGGHLIIGSMFKDGSNTWQDKYAGKGINEFDVTVHGGKDKPSSLSELASTGNNLRTVKVVSDAAQTGTFAALTIGNDNTSNGPLGSSIGELGYLSGNAAALKDVQTFDATGFKGDLTLYAALTSEVTAKYMNLKDAASALAPADNQLFKYDGGTGNDHINLAISSDNLAAAGTTTREDFNLAVNGNDGNDTIVVSVQDDTGLAAGTGNWYTNSALNANLNVAGGAGDDTISVRGSGNWVVSGGDGNDAIYVGNSDNSSDDDPTNPSQTDLGTTTASHHAAWVFNAAGTVTPSATALDDLQSDANDTYAGIYKAKLSVTFKADGSAASYVSKDVVVSSNAHYDITDLDINQAIKAAINTDPVLSKLLVAPDGPANTLVVKSLIDGTELAGDLAVTLKAPDAADLTAAEVTAYNHAQGTNYADAAAMVAGMATNIGTVATGGDYTAQLANGGSETAHVADNIIHGGAGNDVIVLGTGADSNDTIVFDQDVGNMSNGADTVVNFHVGSGSDADKLDFSHYTPAAIVLGGTDVYGASGTLLAGTANPGSAAVNQHYITLIETATAGIYNVNYVDTGATNAATDNVVTLIGTINFGHTVALTADNIA